jgi:glucose/arabinose dehydrogenase
MDAERPKRRVLYIVAALVLAVALAALIAVFGRGERAEAPGVAPPSRAAAPSPVPPAERPAQQPTAPAAAAQPSPPARPTATPSPSSPQPPTVVVAARELQVPWDLAFARDGRVFISERPGRIRVLRGGQVDPTPWATLPVAAVGEGGLLGLALHPRFPNEPYLYAYYTYRTSDGRLLNRVVRLREEDGRGGAPETVIDGIPGASIHDGGALDFGPDGKLYVGTGDGAQRTLAPQREALAGKVLRLEPDGGVPADNPFPGSPVYSLGHRNVQGLAWDAQGRLYATEHGPSGEDGRCCHDEVNLIVPGGNYGWPTYAGAGGDARFRDPIVESGTETWAPSGAAFWRGSLYVAALRGAHLRRLTFGPDGQRVVANEALLSGAYGRLRAVVAGPDGALWLTTSNRDGRGRPAPEDDRLLRLSPAP